MAKLFWTEGPAKIRLYHTPSISTVDSMAAVRILDDFRAQCQRLWFAFNGMINGRSLSLQRFRQLEVSKHNKLSVGTQFPEQEQSIGRSTIAEIPFGELLDAMADGGEFEQLNTKALLVFIDVLWEETTRDKIADVLHVEKQDVKCDLLGDIHRLRNLIIHQSEKAKQDYVRKTQLLPRIWTIDPDDVIITASMLHALMEQLNSMHVHVGEIH